MGEPVKESKPSTEKNMAWSHTYVESKIWSYGSSEQESSHCRLGGVGSEEGKVNICEWVPRCS